MSAESISTFCFSSSLDVSTRPRAVAIKAGGPPAAGEQRWLAMTIVPSKAMAAAQSRCSKPSLDSPPNLTGSKPCPGAEKEQCHKASLLAVQCNSAAMH